MTHVVMQNFCYDVPVKLFSMHLLLMAICVLVPDSHRLLNVFVRNGSVQAVAPRLPYRTEWLDPLHLTVKWLLVAFISWSSIASLVLTARFSKPNGGAEPPAWFGTYTVETFERDGAIIPPTLSDQTRWHRLIIARYPDYSAKHGASAWNDYLMVRSMTGAQTNFSFVVDADTHELRLRSETGATGPMVFKYQENGTNLVALEAGLSNAVIKAHLRRVERSHFLLANRGFHWINEYPMNR
jgi:hypothetical protein